MDDRRPHGDHASAGADTPGIDRYEIRLHGDLHPRWGAWFDGLTVTPGGDGTTVITGPVADQAALHGLLERIRDLGIPLVALTRLDGPRRAAPTARPTTTTTTSEGDSQ